MWNQDLIQKAWNFTSNAHKDQLLPGTDWSYLNHIGNVVFEAMGAIASGTVAHPDLLLLCSILHDTIEDTDVTYDDILQEFGAEVADGVQALSKDESLPAKTEQMRDSLTRIQDNPPEVAMVKLCDRITNLQEPPHYWNKEKISQYCCEAKLILSELGYSNDALAQRLSLKIEEYKQYE